MTASNPKRELFKLYITTKEGVQVDCIVSEDILLGLNSEFGSIFDSTNDNPLGKAVQLLSKEFTGTSQTLATVQGSTQIWKGSTSGSFAFTIDLTTDDDPKKDVRDKMIKLYKMVVPKTGAGIKVPDIIPVFGGKSFTLIQAPSPVTLDIEGVLHLQDYYVTSVSLAQSHKLMRKKPGDTPLPMRATGTIEVIPSKMMLQSDISNIFPNGTS